MVLISGIMDVPVFGSCLIYYLIKEMEIYLLIGIIVIFTAILYLIIPLYVLYKYVLIKRPIKDNWKFLSQYDIRFILALFLVWLSSSFSLWIFLRPIVDFYRFSLFNFFLYSALTLFISYFLVKGVISSDKFTEHLLLDLVVFVELIIVFIAEFLFRVGPELWYLEQLPGLLLLFIYSFAYIVCGAYQLRLASNMQQ